MTSNLFKILIILVPFLLCGKSMGRPDFTFRTGQTPSKNIMSGPNQGLEVHKINKMALTITNSGFFGTGYFSGSPIDPETGLQVLACEYPVNSNVEYLWVGSLWLGAVVGRDTLVTTGAEAYYYIVEFWPDEGEKGQMIRRSTQPFSIHYSPDAISEEDIIAVYTDTLTNEAITGIDPVDNRPHQPLNVKVTQTSYAWSYPYADDFILFDFNIENIGVFPLRQLYIGIVVDADAYHLSSESGSGSWLDDICGYKETIPSPIWPGLIDTIRVAWVADNDGDPANSAFGYTSTTGVTATRVIRTPSDSLEYSFNWWVTRYTPQLDWGPRQVNEDKPYRDFGPNFGTPRGDRNKYYMLSTREFDYDQLECAIPHGNGWLPPDNEAVDYADGHNSIYLFSFGPFDLQPNDSMPVTIAYIGGEDFHHIPSDFENDFNPYNPGPYQSTLDFTNLGLNSIWAEWIFDNPGIDTDDDGDSGVYLWRCEYPDTTIWHAADDPPSEDTISAFCKKTWIKGDGEPDFRGAAPPPAPRLRVIPDYGKLTLRWNGQASETALDFFSGEIDFEGFKIYFAEDNRYSDFVLLTSYDRRNYNRHRWNSVRDAWEMSDSPIDYDTLLAIYGYDFDPDLYTARNPLNRYDPRNVDDIDTYFTPQGWNESNLSDPYGIHKIYPHADPGDPGDTTLEGFHRFYEYEYILDGLSPSRPVYLSVTAFDYGSRVHFLSAQETSPLTNATLAYALTSSDEVEERGLDVFVYPNPYRIDGGYASGGYENRDRTKAAERSRAVHFANLPAVCVIRIYTISGDLVKEINHSYPESNSQSMVETWNLISRNTQSIMTGIYIWSVTSEMGDQLGKLVILK